jgi:hypothetical protein
VDHLFTRCLAGAGATVTVTALAVTPAAHASQPWRAPVDAPVSRAFDFGANPFKPGQHRGVDFAARAGATVRAACGGRVLVAGRVGTSGRVVTIRCGPWRATHLPLATVSVRTGTTIRRGTEIGTLAPSAAHAGLHLGARRDGSPFGYTDPLGLIGHDPPTPPLVTVRRIPRGAAPRPAPVPARAPHVAPSRPPVPARAPVASSPRVATPSGAPPAGTPSRPAPPAPAAQGSIPLAPWPAWAGLAALLAGTLGTGLRVRARTRRAPVATATAQEVP